MHPVQYWSDVVDYKDTVQHFLDGLTGNAKVATPLILNRAKLRCKVNVSGQNAFGSVDIGILTVEASWVRASLGFDRIASPPGGGGFAREYFLCMRTETYKKVRVPFFADYSLHLPGPHRLDEGAKLMVLLVHPKVSLVLRQKVYNQEYVYIDGQSVWERIGIARLPKDFNEDSYLDWMKNSELGTFKIV